MCKAMNFKTVDFALKTGSYLLNKNQAFSPSDVCEWVPRTKVWDEYIEL